MAIFPVGSTAATFSGDVVTLPVGSVSATFLGMRFPENVPTYIIGYMFWKFVFLASFSGVATFLVVTGPTYVHCMLRSQFETCYAQIFIIVLCNELRLIVSVVNNMNYVVCRQSAENNNYIIYSFTQ